MSLQFTYWSSVYVCNNDVISSFCESKDSWRSVQVMVGRPILRVELKYCQWSQKGFQKWVFLIYCREGKVTIQNGSKAFVIVWALKKYLWVNISLFCDATVIVFSTLVSKISISKTELPLLGQVNYVLCTGAK